MSEYFTKKELLDIGFSRVGKNCKISNKIRCYSISGSIGTNSRIDDDVILKGKIIIKNNVHISRGCNLSGGKDGILMKSFSAISNFTQMFTSSDNYFAPGIPMATLHNQAIKKFSKFYRGKIVIGKMVLVGTFSLILPNAHIGDYSSIGAFSIVKGKIKSGIFFFKL